MRYFSKEKADAILRNRIDSQTLALQFPDLKESVLKEFSLINETSGSEDIAKAIDKYKTNALLAINRIQVSGENQKTINVFLPEIIKARIAVHILEQIALSVQTGRTSGRFRFNLWDGFILQRILFRHDLERKPVSLFWFNLFWPVITDKKILMPLVNKKGIYCFYSKQFLLELTKLVGHTRCLEIGAGDGTLTRFLGAMAIDCTATDDYSWEQYIQYPDTVEKLDARQALQKYKPDTVICSWPPPGNTFEKIILNTESVGLYIAIGKKNPLFAGDHDLYEKHTRFAVEYSPRLASLLLPPSQENAVYIFRRIK